MLARSLLETILLVFGAIASYFRFFKGRTFSPRLTINATVEVFPIDAAKMLHVLNVDVKNVGSTAIWGLEPRVEIYFHGEERTEEDIGTGGRLSNRETESEGYTCLIRMSLHSSWFTGRFRFSVGL